MTKKTSHTNTQNPKPKDRKKMRIFATMHSIMMLSVLTKRWKMSMFCHSLMVVISTIKSIITLFVFLLLPIVIIIFQLLILNNIHNHLFPHYFSIICFFLFARAIDNTNINKNDTWKRDCDYIVNILKESIQQTSVKVWV